MPLAPGTPPTSAWSPLGPNTKQAEHHHQVAVAFARRRDWEHALEEALRAVHLDSASPEYETTYAWLLYQAGPPRKNTDAQISAHLNRALKLHREHAQAHYVLGLLRKRQSKHEAAEAHFRMALEGDPEHLEAERELRLYKNRRARNAESGLMRRIVDRLTTKRVPPHPAADDDADE
jgi:tetratricopeptide (TPR) repeat protein